MPGLIRLIEALILGGSVGTKFIFGNSAVRLQPVVGGGCSLHEKVLAAESKVQFGHLICAWIGSEGSCPLWKKVPAAKSAMQACLSLNVSGMEAKEGTATAAKGSAIVESIAQQLRSRRKEAPVAFALQET